jgi:hypothetical protein
MSHKEEFKKFVNEISNYDYVIMRGYHTLPKHPKGDLDIVFRPNDYDNVISIAKMLKPDKLKNYGFAEWTDMKYWPHYTTSDTTKGRFRLDLYNSIYFLSPINNYTTYWTIPESYFNHILENRRLNNFYYVPSYQDEIVLTIMRAVLDRRGWKNKYTDLCSNLLTHVNSELLINSLKLSSLPDPKHIYNCLLEKKYEEIVTWE